MPLFKYHSMTAKSRKMSGIIEADSLTSAKESLRLQSMIITHIFPYTHPRKKQSIPSAELLDITRMISKLLHAGIPLYETLVIVEKNTKLPCFLTYAIA